VQIAFSPTSAGAKIGTLTVTDSSSGSTPVASLTGTAVAPAALTVSPGSASFGTLSLGTSTSAAFTLRNPGGTATSALLVSVSTAEFAVTNDACSGVALPANGSCTFSVVFTPTTAGVKSGIVVASEAGGLLVAAQISGTGI
jgi:hypothetical protein